MNRLGIGIPIVESHERQREFIREHFEHAMRGRESESSDGVLNAFASRTTLRLRERELLGREDSACDENASERHESSSVRDRALNPSGKFELLQKFTQAHQSPREKMVSVIQGVVVFGVICALIPWKFRRSSSGRWRWIHSKAAFPNEKTVKFPIPENYSRGSSPRAACIRIGKVAYSAIPPS